MVCPETLTRTWNRTAEELLLSKDNQDIHPPNHSHDGVHIIEDDALSEGMHLMNREGLDRKPGRGADTRQSKTTLSSRPKIPSTTMPSTSMVSTNPASVPKTPPTASSTPHKGST